MCRTVLSSNGKLPWEQELAADHAAKAPLQQEVMQTPRKRSSIPTSTLTCRTVLNDNGKLGAGAGGETQSAVKYHEMHNEYFTYLTSSAFLSIQDGAQRQLQAAMGWSWRPHVRRNLFQGRNPQKCLVSADFSPFRPAERC